MNVSFFWQSAKEMCLEEAAFGRHRERRSRVAIQPLLATAAGLTAGLLRSTRNDVLKPRFRQRRRRASSSGEDGRLDLSRTADDFKRLKGWCVRAVEQEAPAAKYQVAAAVDEEPIDTDTGEFLNVKLSSFTKSKAESAIGARSKDIAHEDW